MKSYIELEKKLEVLGTLGEEQDTDKNFGVKVQQQMAVSLRMKVSESQGTLDQIRRNFRPITDKENEDNLTNKDNLGLLRQH